MSPGGLKGSIIVGALKYFSKRYGLPAVHELYARLPAPTRALLQPHAPAMGTLPSRTYSYALIGEVVRVAAIVAHAPDEDVFIREIASAGMDETLSTVHRVALRYLLSPQEHSEREQQVWDLYHDSGRVRVLSLRPQEFVLQMSEWPGHDVTVCKICMEGRRRVFELAGQTDVTARREKCQAWGHDVCVARFRWSGGPSESR